ncbi:MAG: ACP phosphodiesterase [Ferruginibacter sp.]
MNYLAHAYLSFQHPEILLGNMISDFVKGKKQFAYPPGVQKGIQLHRAIDQFTDTHPATARMKDVFRPHYRLYAGAFADVVYDHFLANDSAVFADEAALRQFAAATYEQLEKQSHLFPARFGMMFPYMQSQNWLYHYRFREGTQKSFGGLVRRAAYLEESDTAFALLEAHYAILQECYTLFFPAVKAFAADQFNRLLKS